jgi:hypothetical protein
MSKALSPTMQTLVAYMRTHGGKIHRHPGGYWSHAEWNQYSGGITFGTNSVEAIVSRGAATYTEWQESKRGGGRFPIVATLN